MIWIKTSLKFFIPTILVISGLEFGARLFIETSNPIKMSFADYNEAELDYSLPFIHERNGGSCVNINKGFNWNQWWGFSARSLDFNCAKEFFKSESISVVFLGGSTMHNAEAPNYLTTLDYLAIKDIQGVRSINLAESGARHMNMSIRFQREVIPLSPDLVIFLDGYNEFNSIIYGGSPGDDFYWTASGKIRMHNPYRIYIDKVIEKSKFLELALVRSGLYNSSRNVSNIKYNEDLMQKAADSYLADQSITSALCEKFSIKCLFVIQPQVFNSSLEEHIKIISHNDIRFPHSKDIRISGYNRILNKCSHCIDLSDSLNGVRNSFYDPVHFGKSGSKRLGKLFEDLIVDSIDQLNKKTQ